MEPKPGVKTSELWVSGINALITLALAYGAVNAEQADALAQLGAALVFAVAGSVPLAVYVWSRAEVKSNGGRQ